MVRPRAQAEMMPMRKATMSRPPTTAAARVNRPSTSRRPTAISTTGRAWPTTPATSYGRSWEARPARADDAGEVTLRAPATTSTQPRTRRASSPTTSRSRSRSRSPTGSVACTDAGSQLGGHRAQGGQALRRGRGVHQAAHQCGPDDDPVSERRDLGGLGAGGDAEPDTDGQVDDGTGTGHQGGGRITHAGAGPRDAHRRGGVDEPAAGGAGAGQTRVGGARRHEEDPVEVVALGGGDPRLPLVGDEVGGDQPGSPRRSPGVGAPGHP